MCKLMVLLFRAALKASSARLDPLDAVNVIANRGAGDRFFHVASAYRCAPLRQLCWTTLRPAWHGVQQ